MPRKPRVVRWGGDQSAYYGLRDSRHTYLYDAVIALTALEPSQVVLDFGCGSGDFLAEWLVPRVRTAWGFDHDAEAVRHTTRRLQCHPNAGATRRLADLPGGFDIAFLNAVWMTCPSEAACIHALSQAFDLVRAGGRLVATSTHPCFRDIPHPDRRADFRRGDYFESGENFRVSIDGADDGPPIALMDYHWTLSDMSRQLYAAGWRNLRLSEIQHEISPPRDRLGQLPVWLIVQAEKPL